MDTLAILQQNPPLLIAAITIFSLLVGSFLNVVIHRLPKILQQQWESGCAELRGEAPPENPITYRYLITPRSSCPKCGHMISALENIPVLSYLFLRGKCRGCKTPISARYPLVELLTGVLGGLIAWKFGYSATMLFALAFMFALIALTFIDFDTQLLPDDITLPLLWLGLIVNMAGWGFTDLQSAVIGAIAGYMSLWSIYWLFKLLTGKEGMGYGDFKLFAAIGAWFGWKVLPASILLASVMGAFIGIGMMVFAKHGRNQPMPFGPYLALGGIAALFFGAELAALYAH